MVVDYFTTVVSQTCKNSDHKIMEIGFTTFILGRCKISRKGDRVMSVNVNFNMADVTVFYFVRQQY